MSLNIDHREKIKALNELIKIQKENKKRDVMVLIVSIAVNRLVSLIIKFL
jgi:hypothetical protein